MFIAKHSMTRKIIYLIVLYASASLGAPNTAKDFITCSQLFTYLAAKPPVMPKRLDGERYEANESHILKIMKAKAESPEKYNQFEDWYLSHLFFDRKEILLRLLADKEKKLPNDFFLKRGESPLDGYKLARNYLFSLGTKNLNIGYILQTHSYLMSKGSISPGRIAAGKITRNGQKLKTKDLGTFREFRVGYDEPEFELHPEKYVSIISEKVPLNSPENYDALEALNPFLFRENNFVEYTPLSRWKKYSRRLSQNTINELIALKQKGIDLDSISTPVRHLRKIVLEELITYSLNELNVQLKNSKNTDQLITAISNFYYEFVSIHPFLDGNGSVGRLLVEALLNSFGLPPPVFVHFEDDVVRSPQDVANSLKESIALSGRFHHDLQALIEAGGDYRYLPTPYLTEETRFPNNIAPDEFMTWVRFAHLKLDDFSRALRLFVQWRNSLNYYGGESPRGAPSIRLASPLFIETFGRLSPSEAYYKKKQEFYMPFEYLYRGISSQERYSNEEILSYFTQIRDDLVGVSLQNNPAEIEGAFQEFNKDLANSPLKIFAQKVYNHSMGNSAYWKSKYISTSKIKAQAEIFADGALMGREHNLTIKSRIVITAAMRRVGSVDISNLKILKKKLPFDEKEVLLSGAVDPESIQIIEVTDINVTKATDNEVTESTSLKKRSFERVSFNIIKVTETKDGDNKPKVMFFRIKQNGTISRF